MVDARARVVDRGMPNAERIALRRPTEVVGRARVMAAMVLAVDLVDRHDLARLGLSQELLVMKAPAGGGVAAESAAGEVGVGAGTGPHVENTQLDHVARLGIGHGDWSGAEMHAEAFARAPAVDRRVHRSGASAVDRLAVLGPVEDALGPRIALD